MAEKSPSGQMKPGTILDPHAWAASMRDEARHLFGGIAYLLEGAGAPGLFSPEEMQELEQLQTLQHKLWSLVESAPLRYLAANGGCRLPWRPQRLTMEDGSSEYDPSGWSAHVPDGEEELVLCVCDKPRSCCTVCRKVDGSPFCAHVSLNWKWTEEEKRHCVATGKYLGLGSWAGTSASDAWVWCEQWYTRWRAGEKLTGEVLTCWECGERCLATHRGAECPSCGAWKSTGMIVSPAEDGRGGVTRSIVGREA